MQRRARMQISIQHIPNQFKIFANRNILNIGQEIGLNTNLLSSKLSVATLSNHMFKYLNIDLSLLKSNFNIAVKTIRLKTNGVPKESMSFEQIDFHAVVNENWNSSFLKEKFTDTTFLFVVFEYYETELYFKGLKLWKMPKAIVDNDLQNFWLLLKNKLETGVTLKTVESPNRTITKNDLPSSADSAIMHVRPKAQNAQDTTELPDGQLITKQSYWFNNSFVSTLLSDMPPLQIASAQVEENKASDYNYNRIKPLLTKEIYTISEFIQTAQQVFSKFHNFDVHNHELNKIGYKLSPPFITSSAIQSADAYFSQQILSDRYFTVKDEDVWQSPYVKRKLDNMENDYTIFKIEDGLYLTETALQYASINKNEIMSYRESIEDFVEDNQYFTFLSLKREDFQHPVYNYGFDQLFYESLLKRPGRLKSIKLGGQLFFVKTTSKVDIAHFIHSVFIKQHETRLSLDDLLEIIEDTFYVKLDFEAFDLSLSSTLLHQYYSKQMKMLFASKNEYLDFIH